MINVTEMNERIEFYIANENKFPMLEEPYHLKAIGLPNIYLLNGVTFEQDEEYGDVVHIENLKGLHRAIGLHIIEKPDRLTGKEFRFLRKQLGLTQQDLGEKLGISDQTIANYEKQVTGIGPAEAFLRFAYLLHILPEDARTQLIKKMVDEFGKHRRRPARLADNPRRRLVQGWQEQAFSACAA